MKRNAIILAAGKSDKISLHPLHMKSQRDFSVSREMF